MYHGIILGISSKNVGFLSPLVLHCLLGIGHIVTLFLRNFLGLLLPLALTKHRQTSFLALYLAHDRLQRLGGSGGSIGPHPPRSEEDTSANQPHRNLHSFPTRRSSDLTSAFLARSSCTAFSVLATSSRSSCVISSGFFCPWL